MTQSQESRKENAQFKQLFRNQHKVLQRGLKGVLYFTHLEKQIKQRSLSSEPQPAICLDAGLFLV